MTDLSEAIAKAKTQRKFLESLVELRGIVSKGVYPNITRFTQMLNQFQSDLSPGGEFFEFSNDPLLDFLLPFFSSDAITKLNEGIAAIEEIERETMSSETGQGIFELNLPI